jgi:ADP-ribose pyrophosphatase YjhB (NUDIX family)
MWLFTTTGFFNVIQKPGEDQLTVQASVARDLVGLRDQYMPEITDTANSGLPDYPFEAKISRDHCSKGLSLMVTEIIYPDFLESVTAGLGKERGTIYSKISETLHELDKFNHPGNINHELPISYGGVVIKDWQVLLRKPDNQKGGYQWTFPKSKPKGRQTPEETALASVKEKTGVDAKIVAEIPGTYFGETTRNAYFLMAPVNPDQMIIGGSHKAEWVHHYDAKKLLSQSASKIGRNRDLQVLNRSIDIYKEYQEMEKLDSSYGIWSLERDILTTAALRFDGYKYHEKTGFDHGLCINNCLLTQSLPDSHTDRLCIFFMLQRFLMKWGGDMLPVTDPNWRLFRTLFLDLCNSYIPFDYRFIKTGSYIDWEMKYSARAQECKAIVQLIHQNTEYTEYRP